MRKLVFQPRQGRFVSGPGKEVSMREAARFTLSELLLTIVMIVLLFSLAAAAPVRFREFKGRGCADNCGRMGMRSILCDDFEGF